MVDTSRIAALFEELCDLPDAERSERLEALTDDALRDRLRALLEADKVASRVLGTQPGHDGSALLAADLISDAIPERIGRFRILQRLGAGAMGVIYEAEQDHPRRRVALKQLHPWLRSEIALQLFRFEAQALGQVSHPCIPVVYEAGESDGAAYLTMERVHGTSLLIWASRTRASLDERVRVLIHIAEAVAAAHEAGLIHRDLKPQNILVTDQGLPKLLDFGVAAPLRSRQVGNQPGTPLYMSPEQARGESVGTASDQHSLGTVAYELLTGRLPIASGDIDAIAAAKGDEPVPANAVEPALDRDVARAVQRALAPLPEDRYPSVSDWAMDLQRALDAQPLTWVPHTLGYLLGRFVRRHRRALIRSSLALLLIAGAIGGWSLQQTLVENRRLDAAEQRRKRMVNTAEQALDAGDFATAARVMRAFVDDPQHAWTPARVRAWLWWSEHVEEDQRLSALAEAWLTSRDLSDEVGIALAKRFQIESRWSELWRLQAVLSPEARAQVRPALQDAAVARRDFAAARALGAPAMVDALQQVTRLPLNAHRAFWMDFDGDGRVELIAMGRGVATVSDAFGAEIKGTIDQSGEVGWITSDHFVAHNGTVWASAQDQGGRISRLQLTPEGLHEQVLHRHLGGGRIHDLEFIRTPVGERFLLATGYPSRRIRWIDPISGQQQSLHPATDALSSDVMSLLVADLNGDGVDELVAAMGAWNADDVRVLSATDTGYALAGRLHLGTVTNLALLPRPGKNPLILATKADLEQNLRMYSEDAPFGPEAGIYLLEWTGSELTETGFVPMPIADRSQLGPEQSATLPTVGDFDGDGTLDVALILTQFDVGPGYLTWIVSDILGARENLVLAALRPLSAADLDGDGDDELLVSDDDYDLWVLGLGNEALPIWEMGAAQATLPDAPSEDIWVRRGWERARQLVSVGLPAEATRALTMLPGLSEQPEARAAANLAAAKLLESAGDVQAAEPLYAVGFELDPADDEVAQGLLRTRVASLDLVGARQIAEHLGTHSWLQQVPPPIAMLDVANLDGWHLHHPGVFSLLDDTVQVEAFNDQDILATREVRVDGPVVGVHLELEIDDLELAAGLAVDLVGGPNRRELLIGFWGQGGGGITKLYQHCAGPSMQDVGSDRLNTPLQLEQWAYRFGPENLLRCGTRSAVLDFHPNLPSTGIEPGRYTLRIRVMGVPDYTPPMRMIARIRRIETVGMVPVETARAPSESARLELALGDVPTDLPTEELAWTALANGDTKALKAALQRAWDRKDRTRLRWLLRSRGSEVVPLLSPIAGPGFPRLFMEAWAAPGDALHRSATTNAELLRPSLAVLPPQDPAAAELRLLRSSIRLEAGERARARSLAISVRDSAPTISLRRNAWLAIARSSTGAEAKEALSQALKLDPTGVTQERLRMDHRLGPLLADPP